MIDGGVLAGYLAVAATRVTGRVFDQTVDRLFDRLAEHVAQRLGWQTVESISSDPGSPQQQARVGQRIDAAARGDAQFAAELVRLQDRLDQLVGRQTITTVNARPNVQAFGEDAYGGDHHEAHEVTVPDPTDYSKAPAWVTRMIVVGLAIALVGFGMAFAGILGFMGGVANTSPTNPPDLAGMLAGFGVFLVGLVVLVVANVGRALARKR
jgi:hypothetical protein